METVYRMRRAQEVFRVCGSKTKKGYSRAFSHFTVVTCGN